MKFLLVVLVALSSASATQSKVASDLNEQGLAASEKLQFAEAKKLYGESIAMYQELGPSYKAHIGVVKMNLAQVYGAEGNRGDCAKLLEESVALLRGSLGIENVNSLTAANILGGMYMMLGENARASELFNELLPIERKLYPNDVQLARTLAGLASLQMRGGHADGGMPIAEEALAVTLRAEGDDTLDAALSYANLAEGHRLLGRPARALPLFRKSRAIYERLLGPEHARVSSVMTQEGLMEMAEGKLGTAEQTLTRALEIVEKSCPRCTYERVAAENNLAVLRIRQGKYDEADRLLSDVLSLQDKPSALPAQEIAVTLQSLAVVRQKERRYEDAERLKRRADVLVGSYR